MLTRYTLMAILVTSLSTTACSKDDKADDKKVTKKNDKKPDDKKPDDKKPDDKKPDDKKPDDKKPDDKKPDDAKPDDKKPDTSAGASMEVPGFHGLHVPAGGKSAAPPHGGSKMVIYSYQKPRDDLAKEMMALLKAHKWTIKDEKKSPRGSVRLKVEKDGKNLDVRVAGRGPRAALILSRR